MEYFLHALKCEDCYSCKEIHYVLYVYIDEVHGDRSKASIKQRCEQYLNRAEELKKYVKKKNKKTKVAADGGGPKSSSKK